MVTKAIAQSPADLEDTKVASAVKTDFILSAEIMAITLASMPPGSVWMQAVVLAVVGLGITAVVYGGVALIVKADDAGVALAANRHPVSAPLLGHEPGRKADPQSSGDRLLAPLTQGFGRGLVKAMPYFLAALGVLGTAAMIWVGGGILIHGFETYGAAALAHAIADASARAAVLIPAASEAVAWLVTAVASGAVGLLAGCVVILVVHVIAAPLTRLCSTDGGHQR
jgi:predicted DNA repair protein MutK